MYADPEMGGKSSHPRNQKCDGALFILGRRASTSGCGAADFFCPRFNHSVTWKHEADIVNNGGEKVGQIVMNYSALNFMRIFCKNL